MPYAILAVKHDIAKLVIPDPFLLIGFQTFLPSVCLTAVTCPGISQSASTAVGFPQPTYTFPTNSQTFSYQYTLNGQVIGTFQYTAGQPTATHSLSGFNIGTNFVALIVTDNFGNTAFCSFTYVVVQSK